MFDEVVAVEELAVFVSAVVKVLATKYHPPNPTAAAKIMTLSQSPSALVSRPLRGFSFVIFSLHLLYWRPFLGLLQRRLN